MAALAEETSAATEEIASASSELAAMAEPEENHGAVPEVMQPERKL
jgi:methyl-accepting chemotaxis protein